MARTCMDQQEEEKSRLISTPEDEDEDEEEEEALSLCDLPIISTPRNKESSRNEGSQAAEEDFDFDFGSGSMRFGSVKTEPAGEMCTADELFFQGRILPLRHSISSDTGLMTRDPTRFLSRSESVDFQRTGSFASAGSSSRSSSCKSHNSSISEPRIKNQFIIYGQHPSPQPQLRRTSSMRPRVSYSSRNQKVSVWDFFRLGLVRAPDMMELQDIKTRNNNISRASISRNSSCGSNSSTSTSNSSNKNGTKIVNQKAKKPESKQGFVLSDKRSKGFLFTDCKCSVDTAAETVPLNNAAAAAAAGAGVARKTTKVKDDRKRKEEKQLLSRYRTFEWLKELSSHANFVDHGS